MLVAKFGGYHENIAKILATQGAQEYVKNNQNWFDVFRVRKPTLELAKEYIQSADLQYVNTQGHSVAYYVHQYPNVLKYFIEYGLDINTIDIYGHTQAGLIFAHNQLHSKDPDMALALLLIQKINPHVINEPITNHRDTMLHAILTRASLAPEEEQANWYTVFELLLNKGANTSAKNKNGYTPLELARRYLPISPENKLLLRMIARLEKAEKQ